MTGVILVLFIAFFFRVIMISDIRYHYPVRNDAREYYNYAINLKFNQSYSRQAPQSISDPAFKPVPDKIRPPGYALFIAPWVKFPANMAMVYNIQFVQVIVDTLTVLLSFGFCRLLLSYRAALFAMLLVAVSPHLIAMNIYILTESLFTFFLILYLYITAKGLQQNSLILFFLSGSMLAITMLIKPTMNYFIFFIGPMLLFTIPKDRRLTVVGVMLLGLAITIGPWSIRNMGVNSVGPDKAIDSLKNGSYPGLMFNNDPRSRSIPHRADPNYKNITTLSEFLPDLIDKVTNKPSEYLSWYLFGKPKMLFSWDMVMVAGKGDIYTYPIVHSPYFYRQSFRITHALMKGAHNIIVISSLLLLIMLFIPSFYKTIPDHARSPLILCAVIFIYFTLVHIVTNPLPRYFIPLRPIQLLMATYIFSFVYKLIKHYGLRT